MKQNKRIAVTGGIGSGKSTLLNIIRQTGYPVFSCDEVSQTLWKEPAYRNGLALLFPDCCINGEIDKQLLTQKVFRYPEERNKLNEYSHGKIMERLFALAANEPVAFFEVPLLFESGYEKSFDRVIVVMRQKQTRLESVSLRDGLSQEQVLNRINTQTDYEHFAREDVLIVQNDASTEELQQKFLSLLPSIVQ